MVSRYDSFVTTSPPPLADGLYVYYDRFPAGSTKLASQNLTKCYTHRDHVGSKPRCRRSIKVKLPKLNPDTHALPTKAKGNCSFINNHKTYLRMKGFKLSDVYSLKRHAVTKTKVDDTITSSPDDSARADNSPINLPYLFDTSSSNKKNRHKQQENVWKPNDSKTTKNRDVLSHRRSMKELDDEIYIPGHLPREQTNDHRLGKVLTAGRLNEILTEEKPVIPKAFYISSPEIPSPRHARFY